MKVVLARTAIAAKQFAATTEVAGTVEAEYGTVVIKGTKVTLAHHTGQYAGQLPPSARTDVPVLGDKDIILISHIDGDTVGGVASLMGRKPENPEFWKAIAFLDEQGPHHLHEIVDPQLRRLVMAYNGFYLQHFFSLGNIDNVTDVTAEVEKHITALERILSGDEEFIFSCIDAWKANEAAIEQCLELEEAGTMRVFISDGPFCNGAYYSPRLEQIIPAVVTRNTATGAIIVSFADGGQQVSACEIVQSLWGPEAGGHAGIAGSPRGKKMNHDHLYNVVALVLERLHGK
ncbi:hypothetical protein [Shimazuella kribbensis]|uniref:hypothetical protein n=1 Tax=Shimazuella kribbensis TaxID=139808 RepID=UPI00048E74E5|nr:hypothetical protein [Shimazuella kribbensis]